MVNLSTLFSLVFFIVFAIYVFFGIYILSLNPKANMNRTFFAVCVTLCMWSFSFSIANSALNYSEALLWRRVSGLGWGTLYSFLLHFVIILTERERIFEKKWTYAVLYFPALINISVFSAYSDLAVKHHKLINTSLGWVNTSINGFWDWHFNIYYMGFMSVGIGLIWNWGRYSSDSKKSKQSKLLMASFVFAMIVGTFTDVVFNKYLSINTPQVAPVIILIPIGAIAYSIRQYGLMNSNLKKQRIEDNRILNESIRKRIYYFLGFLYIAFSMINFAVRYFIYGYPLYNELSFNLFCFLVGLSFIGIRRLKIKADTQDTILMVILSLSIFHIIMRYAEQSTTVWAIPFMFIMLSVLFNKRRTIFMLSSFVFISQIWLLVKAPEMPNRIDIYDYIVRIGITVASLGIALFVNRIYIDRLEENREQIKCQKMISKISTDFITVSKYNIDEKIRNMLEQIGQHYRVDRVYLFLFSEDREKLIYTHEWCGDGIDSTIGITGEILVRDFPWWISQIINKGIVNIPSVSKLSAEAMSKKEHLEKLKVKSTVAVSVKKKDSTIGMLGFDSVKTTRNWTEDHQDTLKILTNLLADSIVKAQTEREMNNMAYYDSLTGLPNRTLYKRRLEKAIESAQKKKSVLAVISIDLDSFKSVNDTMGHESGDELLKEVSKKLSECIRKQDIVSRFGGDEFLIIVDDVMNLEDISAVADSVMESFDDPITIRDQEFYITASAGIAKYPDDGTVAEELIKNSDIAMYSSKDEGKNRYTFCSTVMKTDVLERVKLTNGLYRALERKELVLHYQPQINAETGEIIGLEALVRWNHPEHGMVSPGVFIPLAEQTGIINSIGEWVLKTACSQNMYWQKKGITGIRMAVNLSIEQFKNPNLANMVDSVLAETGMDPGLLELEITESIVVKDTDHIVDTLNRFKSSRIMIAIDDFGTEYSSLSRLKVLPADRIKIDQQFVQGLSIDGKDEAIVKTIIQLARNLGFKVIAEGVETENQLDFLRKQKCDEIQGYYYYKPMVAEEFEKVYLGREKV